MLIGLQWNFLTPTSRKHASRKKAFKARTNARLWLTGQLLDELINITRNPQASWLAMPGSPNVNAIHGYARLALPSDLAIE